MPSTQASITGCNKLIRCLIETIIIAAIVAANVAIIQGIKISVAFFAPDAARKAIILTGISVRPDACKHKNITCALDALVLSGFISCRLSMAFMPNGVAALSSPRRLAEKFIIMWPCAG